MTQLGNMTDEKIRNDANAETDAMMKDSFMSRHGKDGNIISRKMSMLRAKLGSWEQIALNAMKLNFSSVGNAAKGKG